MDRVYSAGCQKVSEGPISESVCLATYFHLLIFLIVFGIELKVMHMVDKCSAPELQRPSSILVYPSLSINCCQLWCGDSAVRLCSQHCSYNQISFYSILFRSWTSK